MALRFRNINSVNQVSNEENVGVGKNNLKTTTTRSVLGELGNRAQITKPGNKDVIKKKESLVQKPITAVPKPAQVTVPVKKVICKTTTLGTRNIQKKSLGVLPTVPQVRPKLTKLASAGSLVPSRSAAVPLKQVKKPVSNVEYCKPIVVPPIPNNSGVKDVDEENSSDPIMLGEYAPEIFAYLRVIEKKFLVEEDFMKAQQVTPSMRALVVDWLVDVQQQFSLLLETLHLAIGLLDRYLAKVEVTKQQLQLVGACAMWIAAKFEEMFAPELESFVFISDSCFDRAELMKMETQFHKTLEFKYGQPLSIHFLRRYSGVSKVSSIYHIYGKYMLELSLMSYGCRHIRPSLLAASALLLAFCIVDKQKPSSDMWTETLVHYSTYSFTTVLPVVKKLAAVLVKVSSSKTQAVVKKYSSSMNSRVSSCVDLDLVKQIAGVEATLKKDQPKKPVLK